MSTDPSTTAATPKAPTGPPTITLGTLSVDLVEPTSLFSLGCLRTAAEQERGGNAMTRAYGAAALRMCWHPNKTWPGDIRPAEWRIGMDVGEYGGDIWEALRRATKGKVHIRQLSDACVEALNWAGECAITDDEVATAGDFSEGQEGE